MPQVGAAFVAASAWLASPGVGALIGRLLLSTAVSAISGALQKQLNKPQQQGIKTEFTTSGGDKPMTFVVGWYATDGHMVCPPMSHGKFDDWSNAYLTYVIDLGNVPGAQIDKVIIDDTEVGFETVNEVIPQGGVVPSGKPDWWYQLQGIDPAAPNAGTALRPLITPGQPVAGAPSAGHEKYATKIWLRYHDGRQTAADQYLMQVYGPGTQWAEKSKRPWTAEMVAPGTCYAVLTFRYSTKSFNGLPRCRFVMRGTPLYDPRKDSSAGGTGPQRWDDPASWATTTNGMVIAYNILRGIPIAGGPIWGYGVPASALPFAVWAPAMTAADQQVDGQPRWQAAWEVSANEEPASVLDEVLKVCCAKVAESAGRWLVRVGPPAAPVLFFSDDDLILDEDATSTPFPGLEATYNAVHASYPEPGQLWRPKDAPPRYNAGWEAADQGRRLPAELNMPACPWGDQVQRVMRAYIEEERRFRRHAFSLPPDAEALEPLDVIAWSSAEQGYDGKLFEVVEVAENPDTLRITVSVIEVDPADYDWRPDFKLPSTIAPTTVPVPAPVAPGFFDVEGIALSDGEGRPRRPAARLRWGGWSLDGITAVEWELRRAGQTEAAHGMMGNPELGETIVDAGVIPLTDYEARIRFVAGERDVAWTLWKAFRTPEVRIVKSDLDAEVIADVDRASEWMDDTGPFLRSLRDEIAQVRDSVAEIDWDNYSVHQRVRREAVAEVDRARAEFVEQIDVAASATEAVAARVTTLTATVGENTAAIRAEQLVRTNADSALARDVQTVSAATAGNTAAITEEKLARTTADSALSASISDVAAVVGNHTAQIQDERLARISGDESLAAAITTVSSNLGTKASAESVTALTTRVRDTENGLESQSDAITRVSARTNRGTATGLFRVTASSTPSGVETRIGLRAEATAEDSTSTAALYLDARAGGTSHVSVVADRFAIVTDPAAGAARKVPFIVQDGVVYMDAAFIRDGEITNAKIGNEIKSTDFVAGENGSGWRILKSGTAEFNNVIIRRQMAVASGTLSVGTFIPRAQFPAGVNVTSGGDADSVKYDSGAEVGLQNGPGLVRSIMATQIPITEWLGAKKTYLANVGMTGTVNSPDSDNCYWGWTADVLPLTKWSGNQTLRLRLSFWSEQVSRVNDCVLTWKIYEVS